MKKVIAFGGLGALGCLLGWAIGEVFLGAAVPWAKAVTGASAPSIVTPPEPPKLGPADRPKIAEQLTVPTPAPPPTPEAFRPAKPQEPPPPPSADFAARLEREHAHEGAVTAALIWWNRNDLDLHVIDPAREEIFFKNKRAQSGGELDVDMNAAGPSSDEPIEHVFFPQGGAPAGHYKVYVVHYANKGGLDPTAYKVDVMANGQRQVFEGSISNSGTSPRAQDLVCEFDVQGEPAPELRLSAPESLSIVPGGSNVFRVRIARGYFDEPVSIRLDSSYGLTIEGVEIQRGETSATVTIHAESISAGDRTVRVLATAASNRRAVEAVTPMIVRIIEAPKPEPVLKVAVPPVVQVLQGDANRFKVRVGRYFFASSTSATVRLTGNEPDIQGSEITIPGEADEGLFEVKASGNARLGKRDFFVAVKCGSKEERSALSVEVVPLPPPPFGWPMILVVALWTALLAMGLSLLLAIGQNRYLGRKLLSLRQACLLLAGGALAGALAGGGGQALLAWLGQMQARGAGGQLPSWLGKTQADMLAGIPPEAGQIAGWGLLGLLLGYGVAFFVPNLSRTRSTVAGAIGGLVGVGGFLTMTHFVGEMAGRVVGATTLGLAIGLMVALVEVAFREAWLGIQYGPKEVRTVSLGREPISLGSDQSACTVYAAGAAPVAFRYWLKDNAIVCQDVAAKRTSNVLPGDRKQVGNLVATVFAASKPDRAGSARPIRRRPGSDFVLRLKDDRSIKLSSGATLSGSDLPGLHSVPPGGPIALVAVHPTNPAIQGLQNLSHLPWRAHLPNGSKLEVRPGKSLRLAAGIRVSFGPMEGEIQ